MEAKINKAHSELLDNADLARVRLLEAQRKAVRMAHTSAGVPHAHHLLEDRLHWEWENACEALREFEEAHGIM